MSPSFGDGKSFIAVSLASSFASQKEKVIVLDCDRSSSTISKYCTHDPDVTKDMDGISEIIKEDHLLESLIQKRQDLPNVDFIPVGHDIQHLTSLLEGRKFKDIINQLREKYDRIIIDTPPMTATIDAITVSRASDFLIMVTIPDQTLIKDLEIIDDFHDQMNHDNIHVILNRDGQRQTFNELKKNRKQIFDKLKKSGRKA
jgi:Mrp family chromosome partitioning ATPase